VLLESLGAFDDIWSVSGVGFDLLPLHRAWLQLAYVVVGAAVSAVLGVMGNVLLLVMLLVVFVVDVVFVGMPTYCTGSTCAGSVLSRLQATSVAETASSY